MAELTKISLHLQVASRTWAEHIVHLSGLTSSESSLPVHAQAKELTGLDSLKQFNLTEMVRGNSFTIVRDPFERLVSAYEVSK